MYDAAFRYVALNYSVLGAATITGLLAFSGVALSVLVDRPRGEADVSPAEIYRRNETRRANLAERQVRNLTAENIRLAAERNHYREALLRLGSDPDAVEGD